MPTLTTDKQTIIKVILDWYDNTIHGSLTIKLLPNTEEVLITPSREVKIKRVKVPG